MFLKKRKEKRRLWNSQDRPGLLPFLHLLSSADLKANEHCKSWRRTVCNQGGGGGKAGSVPLETWHGRIWGRRRGDR